VQELPRLPAGELHRLNVVLPAGTLTIGKPGIL
jgi:2-methylcitrate dehydratase